MDDVTKSLNATLAHTLADGHCFLHAVALQLNETPNSMKAIETESTRNKNHYRNFIDENSGRLDLLACAFTGYKFDSVHLDLVGPLPTSRGYSYLLTMIDRFTRWVEAVPISDITAETVARTFVHSWIARFGVPLRITHDLGAQFASKLWADVSSLLGCTNFSTTAFHPQSNGLIERVHRDLKTASHRSRVVA
ncbi:Integrase catalytic core [Trinorchestia longiramus]|nr:Integrase catalytic core [Trinorchestia longiramus]